MAMGVSAQPCPSFCWVSHSYPRSSSVSSYAEALRRQGFHAVKRYSRSFSNTSMFSTVQFKQLPANKMSYTTMEHYDRHGRWELVVSPRQMKNSSSSSARMLRQFKHENGSGRKHIIESNQQRIEQEKEPIPVVHSRPPVYLEATKFNSISIGSETASWAMTRQKLREAKFEFHRRLTSSDSTCSLTSELSMKLLSKKNVFPENDSGYDLSTEDSAVRVPAYTLDRNNAAVHNVLDPLVLNHSIPTKVLSNDPSKKAFQSISSLSEDLNDRKKEIPLNGYGGPSTIERDAKSAETTNYVATKENSPLEDLRKRLVSIYDSVLVVDNVSLAEEIVQKLMTKYRHHVHACDTEVAKIDVKQETPIDHGEIICFSIYSGPDADFGNGKVCIWVDILDGGGKDLLLAFAPFFEDPSIKKVWHNYSFDNHVIENYGIMLSGFHADTMHMARLWDSSRRLKGGYSLEALTGSKGVMSKLSNEKELNGKMSRKIFSGTRQVKKDGSEGKTKTSSPVEELQRDQQKASIWSSLIGKVSMKTIFGRKKVKKDGSEGKITTLAPVEELQREERIPWICYSALDAISTLQLYENLKIHLSKMEWKRNGESVSGKSMFDFYKEYWQPFGELLVKMETEGMLVDREYLAEIEKVAKTEQEIAVNRFRNWASRQCADAEYMNVRSDAQLRQLFFGGITNSKDPSESLPKEKIFKVPNVDNVIEEGKKSPTKFRNIKLKNIVDNLPTEMYTATGWPSISGPALKMLAGKVSMEYDFMDDTGDSDENDENFSHGENVFSQTVSIASGEEDTSAYGTAYEAFGGNNKGREACHAIAALCEVCSIDSLISNFILPLQGSNVSGKNGRVHCSLNINTETGRLSARRPNLQNQPALEKDRYKIRQAFIAAPGNSLIVADYGQLELRILAHLADCKSMLDAFKAGGDFHSRTAMNMYSHIREAVENGDVLLEWHPQPGEDKPPVPLLKDAFASERRKAKMLNFSIAYGKTPVGLARDWKVSVEEAKATVDLWYSDRKEVLSWQKERKKEAVNHGCVHTLLGRKRKFPSTAEATRSQRGHIERAAINTPVQGSAADVAMCAMLQISENKRLKELGWKLILQVHDEVILEGPTESAEVAKAIVVNCMANPFNGRNILKVDLSVDAKCAQNWYAGK